MLCHSVVGHLGSLVGTAGVKEPHTTNAFHLNNKTQLFCQTLVYYTYSESQKVILENSSEVVQVSEVHFLYQKEIERPGKREIREMRGGGELGSL